MKTRTSILVLFFLLLGGPIANAQDLMDALKQTAEMHNEANGDEFPNNSEELTEEERERQEEWRREWEEKMKENAEVLDALDRDDKCLALMVLYLNEYYAVKDLTRAEQNCKMKYDLYGMELLLLTSSTTIMYCPEGFAESGNKAEIMEDFISKFFYFEIDPGEFMNEMGARYSLQQTEFAKKTSLSTKLAGLIRRHGNYNNWRNEWAPGDYREFMEFLIKPFEPIWLAYRILVVQEKMEALGCGG
ncbi:MAG: hypothetical protein KJO53_13660 [Eudoraea sp.]|nr:hypothetical protein [Eudoraea sp.]